MADLSVWIAWTCSATLCSVTMIWGWIAVWVVIGLASFADGVKGGEDLAGRALKRAVPGVMQIARLGFQFAQGVVLVDGGDDQRGIGRSVSIDRCDQRHIWDVNGVVGRN